MEDKKKEQIINKFIELLYEKSFGEGSKSARFSLTIDHDKERELLDYSEIKKL